MNRRRRGVATALTPILTLALTACVPDAATVQGDEVAWLYSVFMAVAVAVFVLIVGLMAWSIVRYRGEPGREPRMPAQTHGSLRLEILWWTVPTIIVLALAGLTAVVLAEVDARAEEPAVTVGVEGFQWGWRFTFEEADVVVTGTAVDPPVISLPVGETIAFVIESQDVVHSFSIPAFLIKRDAVPSRENRFDVVIEERGTYSGQCGEFCGLLHARQAFTIEAVERAAFDSWLRDLREEATTDGGG